MQLTLEQPELEEAVRDYIRKTGIQKPVGAIGFTAGRGENGLVASVEITAEGSDSVVSIGKAKPASVKKAAIAAGANTGSAAAIEESEQGQEDEEETPGTAAPAPVEGSKKKLFG